MKVPPEGVAVAFNCVALSWVPKGIAAGVGQVMTGVAWFTRSGTDAVAVELSVASVGVNVTVRVCSPAPSTVPAAGL